MELQHHGVKGQKWGVRRYRNYDGSLTPEGRRRRYGEEEIVAKKGMILGTVNTATKTDLTRPVYLYNNQVDRDVYTGPYTAYLAMQGHRYVYEHLLQATQTIVSPNEKARKQMFYETFRENPNLFKQELKTQYGYLREDVSYERADAELKRIMDGWDSEKTDSPTKSYILDELYPLFSTIHDGYGSKLREAYLEKVRDNGYTALTDDNNRKVYNNAIQPFMALCGDKTLKEIGYIPMTQDRLDAAIERTRKRNFELSGSDAVQYSDI